MRNGDLPIIHLTKIALPIIRQGDPYFQKLCLLFKNPVAVRRAAG
jgi:hypothetical protein